MEIRGRATFQLFKQEHCHVGEGSGQSLGLWPSPAVTDCCSAEFSLFVIAYLGACLLFLSAVQSRVFCGSAVVAPVSVPVPGSMVNTRRCANAWHQRLGEARRLG